MIEDIDQLFVQMLKKKTFFWDLHQQKSWMWILKFLGSVLLGYRKKGLKILVGFFLGRVGWLSDLREHCEEPTLTVRFWEYFLKFLPLNLVLFFIFLIVCFGPERAFSNCFNIG